MSKHKQRKQSHWFKLVRYLIRIRKNVPWGEAHRLVPRSATKMLRQAEKQDRLTVYRLDYNHAQGLPENTPLPSLRQKDREMSLRLDRRPLQLT